MGKVIPCVAALLLFSAISIQVRAGEVAIYTGRTSWIDMTNADAQARICVDKLSAAGIGITWFAIDADQTALAEWVIECTDNGQLDVLVLYGYLPPAIYPAGNTMPDGSIAELFIESTDGDAIINHADYMFFVSDTFNEVGGLQNLMDIPDITMWDDDTPMVVTDEGRTIAPSLTDFMFHGGRPLRCREAGDPDNDGNSNFMEWALLLDPKTPDVFKPILAINGNVLEYTYTRRNTAPGEATFSVEWSDTLAPPWTSVGPGTVTIDGPTQTVKATLPADVPSRFARLKITTP